MIKQIIGKLVSLGAIAGMSAMVYFNNYEYLNVVTIYFTLILLMYAFVIPITSVCLAASKIDKNSIGVLKMFRTIIKTKSGLGGFVNYVEAIANIVLLSTLGYTFIVVIYVVAIAICITIANKAKEWVKEYAAINLMGECTTKAKKEIERNELVTIESLNAQINKLKEKLNAKVTK